MQGFREGYEFFEKDSGIQMVAANGAEYVSDVETEVEKLTDALNSFSSKNPHMDTNHLQGFLAEIWHADTFNIEAVKNGSSNRAYVDQSNSFGSVDISTNFGDKYGLKYYKNGAESARAQARSVFDRFTEYQKNGGEDLLEKYLIDRGYDADSVLNDPIYKGQIRLIPKDQMEAATEWLKRMIATEKARRPEQVKRYEDTLAFLQDRIRDSEGNESIPLSREDSQKLAVLAKEKSITAKDLHMEAQDIIAMEDVLRQAIKAGMTSAMISFVLRITPEIIKIIQLLIRDGKIDGAQFKKMGFAVVSGTAEGFIRGSIAAGVTTACKAGLLGEAAKAVSPSVIGIAVVLTMDTMKNAFKVAVGEMSKSQLAEDLVKEAFIATSSYIGGLAVQAMIPAVPVLGFMIGSFAGSVIGGIAYTGGYQFAISFCIDTGFTMFGLVKQDYSLPEDVLREIGIVTHEIKKHEIKRHEIKRHAVQTHGIKKHGYKTIQPYFLRRGVIGIREIGYIIET